MYQVLAYRMPPMHRSPYRAVGIVLKKQVVFALIIHHAVGIIHPVGLRRKMVSWPVRLCRQRLIGCSGFRRRLTILPAAVQKSCRQTQEKQQFAHTIYSLINYQIHQHAPGIFSPGPKWLLSRGFTIFSDYKPPRMLPPQHKKPPCFCLQQKHRWTGYQPAA